MQIKSRIKNRIFFPGLMILIGFFMLCSLAQAVTTDFLDSERPDWWNLADATLIFGSETDPFPDMRSFGSGTADPAGFAYDYQHFYISPMFGVFNLFLENFHDPSKIKNIWMAFHIAGDSFPSFEIIGDIGGQYIPADIIHQDYADGWVLVDAQIIPQPDQETFTIYYDYFGGAVFDYLEVGTKCVVPIPSALILLGGGLVGLVGLRRRKLK